MHLKKTSAQTQIVLCCKQIGWELTEDPNVLAHAEVSMCDWLRNEYLKHGAEYRRDHLLDLLLVQSAEHMLLFIPVLPPGDRQKEHEKMNVI